MSYILDALKKADQARDGSDVSMLELPTETALKPGNRIWLRAAVVFVGVNILLATTLILYHFLRPATISEPLPTTSVTAPPMASGAAESVELAPKPDASIPPQDNTEDGDLRTPPAASEPPLPEEFAAEMAHMDKEMADLERSVNAAPTDPADPQANTVAPRHRPAVEPLIQQVDIADQTFVPVVPPVAVPIVPSTTSRPSVSQPVSENVAPEPEPEPEMLEMDIPLLKEKPFPFRQSVPEIVLDIHVYSEIPEKRFVMINMKRRREGDDLGNGLKLIHIVPDGMIMIFQGETFRINTQ